jgi:asparagine synthase (glutamine-hydrolysing)
MCGIFVSITDRNIGSPRYQKNHFSVDLLAHRGPDSSSYFYDNRIFLGHTRLEIVDHNSASNQPFISRCGRYILVFNGEIYNYKQLASQFLSKPLLLTDSDTEVIAELWSLFQCKTLELLDGMFSLVVFDRHLRTATLARDCFGIKPLYTYREGSTVVISSEIRAILPHLIKREPNKLAISHYLSYGLYDHTEATFFEGIFALKPGTAQTFSISDSSLISTQSFYDLSNISVETRQTRRSKDSLEELKHLLEECVLSSTIADVPIAANTSGGIDSSLLYSILSSLGARVPALNISFPGTLDASYVATSQLGFDYRTIAISPLDILEHLKDVVRHQSQPFGGIFVVAYSLLYQYAAQRSIKVCLDANCLDELFLGYDKYRPSSKPHSGSLHHDGTSSSLDCILAPGMPSPDQLFYQPLSIPSVSPIRQEAINDLFHKKIPRGLRFNDHVSMQHSVELRVPFLRKQLFEFSLSLPDSSLIVNNIGKYPIRSILARYTSNTLHAFGTKASIQCPQTTWLNTSLRKLLDVIISSPSFLERGWINVDILKKAVETNVSERRNNSFFLWQAINLELFGQAFFD